MANLSGLTAAEVGFLVVKPFKKHPFLASVTDGGQTGNAPAAKQACNSKNVVKTRPEKRAGHASQRQQVK